MEFALTCKAVVAVQIAGMRHMKTQCLDDAGGLFFQCPRHGGEGIRGKELARVLQGSDIVVALLQFCPVEGGVLGGDFVNGRFPGTVFLEGAEMDF